jgi:hypothetical protein
MHHPHSGELTVVGQNSIDIPLFGHPHEVLAYFKPQHHHHHPCDPGATDTLEYQVHHSIYFHSQFVLRLTWSVSGVREIIWHASY